MNALSDRFMFFLQRVSACEDDRDVASYVRTKEMFQRFVGFKLLLREAANAGNVEHSGGSGVKDGNGLQYGLRRANIIWSKEGKHNMV